MVSNIKKYYMIKENYSGEIIDNLINFFKLDIKGILHVGAHKCEELDVYLKHTNSNNIYWIEANPNLVNQLKNSVQLRDIGPIFYFDNDCICLFEKAKKKAELNF